MYFKSFYYETDRLMKIKFTKKPENFDGPDTDIIEHYNINLDKWKSIDTNKFNKKS